MKKRQIINADCEYNEHAMSLNKNSQEYKDLLKQLADNGNYDFHTTRFNTHNMKKVDGSYKYLPKNILFKVTKSIVKGLIFLLSPIINKTAFSLKIIGRENLKGIKSAITISNHVHYLDILMVMQALRKLKLYVIAANHNMKKGIWGYFLKAGGVLPLSNSKEASINLTKAIKQLLEKGNYLHIYPESALWFRYENARPLKLGAFWYAVNNNVPIIPLTILFKQRSKFNLLKRKKKIILKIGKPICPDLTIENRLRDKNLQQKCQEYYNKTICEFYGYKNINFNKEKPMDTITHNMKLQSKYFEKIMQGTKLYEIRLNDEKRQLIKIGDSIQFVNESHPEQTILCKVEKLIVYKTFNQMCKDIKNTDIGFENCDTNQIVETYHKFYSKQDEKKYGVIAIKIFLEK